MYFLEAVKKIGKGAYPQFSDNTELVYSLKTDGNLAALFYPTYVVLASKDSNPFKLDYDEFAAIAVERNGTKIIASFNGETISYTVTEDDKAEKEESFLQSLCNIFSDGSETSPYENIRIICEENGIFFDGKYNKYLYHLIFEYNNLFNLITENCVLPENCSIEFILQEHTAGLFDDTAGTVTNLAGSLLSGNLMGTLFSAGKKLAKSIGNDFIGNNGILVVTNENVIYAKGSTVHLIGETLEEAREVLETERDQTIQGAIDVFFEGEKILDNVSGKLWSEYKNTLRRLRNHPKQKYIEDDSDSDDDTSFSYEKNQDSENELSNIEANLTQLKRMVDGGLISQEDYEAKKNKLLGIAPAHFASKEPDVATSAKAPPLERRKVVNKDASPKKRVTAMLLCFFFGGIGVHRFYCGKIGTGILMIILDAIAIISDTEELYVLMLISLVWAVIDFITLAAKRFKDGNKKLVL